MEILFFSTKTRNTKLICSLPQELEKIRAPALYIGPINKKIISGCLLINNKCLVAYKQ